MAKKAVDKEDPRQPEPEPESAPVEIAPHYATREFNHVSGKLTFSQKKGDIIEDQQKLNLYKKQNAPIALFDPKMRAKCPNPKCNHVFAWDGNA